MDFFNELKRRKVLRTAGLYVVGAWLTLQAAEVLVGLNTLPETIGRPLLIVLITGFPITLVLSWFVDWTPQGFKSTPESQANDGAGSAIPIGIIATAVILSVVGFVVFDGSTSETPAKETEATTIAVLPFASIGSAPDKAYLADGISEQLIGLLARLPSVAVTSRTSAFTFKNTSVSTPEIAQTLGVKFLLNGSVTHGSNLVRVWVELIDAESDRQMWSNTFDMATESLFSIQDQIAKSVAAATQLQLAEGVPRSVVTDAEAHRLYLRAGYASGQEAVDLCRKSIAIDPAYAPAWECLAAEFSNQANRRQIPSRQGYELAEGAARKAIELNPESASAWRTIGYIANYHHGDIQRSATAYLNSIKISPGVASAEGGLSLLLASIGRTDEAITLGERAARKDPVNPVTQANLAACYFWAGRWQDSLERYKIAKTLDPDYFAVQYRMSETLLAMNKPNQALIEAENETHSVYRLIGLAMAHHGLGASAASDAALDELINQHADTAAYNIAYVHAHRNEADAAFEFLEKELRLSGTGVFSEILGDIWFKNLYEDDRWMPFLRKVGRAPDQLELLDIRLPPTIRTHRA